jgi:hypothetical protein
VPVDRLHHFARFHHPLKRVDTRCANQGQPSFGIQRLDEVAALMEKTRMRAGTSRAYIRTSVPRWPWAGISTGR